MLSNPLHRFAPYHAAAPYAAAPALLGDAHVPDHPMDALAQGQHPHPHYALPHAGAHSLSHAHPARAGHAKHRQSPYGAARGSGTTSGTGTATASRTASRTASSAPVRRRISRACDQCNQLRTKCDGQHPCAHCIEFGLGCEYARERKKRGKASRKDLQAAGKDVEKSKETKEKEKETEKKEKEKDDGSASDGSNGSSSRSSDGDKLGDVVDEQPFDSLDGLDGIDGIDLDGYAAMHSNYDPQHQHEQQQQQHQMSAYGQPALAYPDLHASSDPVDTAPLPYSHHGHGHSHGHGHPPTMTAAAAAAAAAADMHSFNGMAMRPSHPAVHPALTGCQSSPAPARFSFSPNAADAGALRYPVLAPLAPHLAAILPPALACDLVDVYFSSASSAQMHPMSPYVVGFIFRKPSFLHPTRPRRCQPALLASMLWVAAQTSDAPYIASVPAARGAICQKLLELTVGLLKPLVHAAVPDEAEKEEEPADRFGAAGTLDDVVTYMHLATVVSASEYKGASLRWWNAAWCLARELKLGREVKPGEEPGMTEEDCEERRRIWWLNYMVDRHLALCYNRPLFLLDVECDGLRRPLDEAAWHRGEFDSDSSRKHAVGGPSYECVGHNMFGFFLPLMTILGEIVDLHHARNHPRFGLGCGFRTPQEWDAQAAAITHHLAVYAQSLAAFEQRTLSPAALVASHQVSAAAAAAAAAAMGVSESQPLMPPMPPMPPRMTELDIQTRIVAAYGTHVMHVLHILLAGKWDPVNLLDDHDLWISSQGFITATGHAVSAAEAISEILEYDPGLEFMPFFFGIYLLQGSFLLLLIADKLQLEASASVVRACETIIRAHEACVVTLNNEYQRNFSRVMRSALAQARGRVPEDLGEQHMRRRELLSLYRWTGDGTGLAL